MLPLCYKDPTSGEGTVSPRHVITSIIYIFIAFLNRYRQAEVVCITIYLKLLIIDRETNQQGSTGSNVGLLPWGHDKPGSNADNIPLLLLCYSLCQSLLASLFLVKFPSKPFFVRQNP